MARQPLEERQARQARLAAHQETNEATMAEEQERQDELARFASMTPGEKADLTRRRSLKQRAEHARGQNRRAAQLAKAGVAIGDIPEKKEGEGAEENKAASPAAENKAAKAKPKRKASKKKGGK